MFERDVSMLKKFLLSIFIILLSLYVLFLIVPFFLTGFINSYDYSKMIEEACGFKVKVENVRLVTTPKLSAGIKVGHIDAALPTGESFLSVDNVQGKLSLLALIVKKIKIDVISADNLNLNLKIKKDGKFLIEDYIKTPEQTKTSQTEPVALPYGLKLSNHLPDIKVFNYNISFIELPTDNSYSIYGDEISVRDFIFDEKIKIRAKGSVLLKDKEQFKYDVKILNKIMPKQDLNDFIFASSQEQAEQNSLNINPIDIFKALYKNQLTADVKADAVIAGDLDNPNLSGCANVSKFSIAVDGKMLPSGNIDLKLKDNKVKLYTKLYTAKDEITEILGDFKTGKNPHVDLNLKSNAKFQSIIDLVDSVAKSFDYNDLDTLVATGGVDADFSIKSDLKKINSSGYLKIPSASLSYKLYNVSIDKIFADIQLQNNDVDIKNTGFSILGQPMVLKGKISQDAVADLSLVADKLQVKGLLLALGQLALLKENKINSGTISANVLLKGKLDKIVPKILLSVDNLNIKNIPSDTSLVLQNSNVDLSTDGKKTNGVINVNNLSIINPMAKIIAPSTKITVDEKDILVNNSYFNLNNSKININGKISDYMTKNINFDIKAKGNLLATDLRAMIPKEYRSEVTGKGAIPLSVTVTGNDKAQDIKFLLSSNPSNYLALLSVLQLTGKPVDIKGNIKLSDDNLKFSNTGIL